MKRVLALSGKRFSGKDTLAAMLVEAARERGVALVTYAFAAESKRLFVERQAGLGVEVNLDRLQRDRAYKEAWRPKLTELTVAAIAADPLVFCRAVGDRIAAGAERALVTDVRLRLEIEHLRSRFDLHLVRLQRSDAARASSGFVFDPVADRHPTETELDDPSLWDEVVDNDGTEGQLAEKARALVDRVVLRDHAPSTIERPT